jgi:uncharacterized MAPEG superfamily protein
MNGQILFAAASITKAFVGDWGTTRVLYMIFILKKIFYIFMNLAFKIENLRDSSIWKFST